MTAVRALCAADVVAPSVKLLSTVCTKNACAHQEARFVGLDALLQRLLNVDGAADAVLRRAQWQLHLRPESDALTAAS